MVLIPRMVDGWLHLCKCPAVWLTVWVTASGEHCNWEKFHFLKHSFLRILNLGTFENLIWFGALHFHQFNLKVVLGSPNLAFLDTNWLHYLPGYVLTGIGHFPCSYIWCAGVFGNLDFPCAERSKCKIDGKQGFSQIWWKIQSAPGILLLLAMIKCTFQFTEILSTFWLILLVMTEQIAYIIVFPQNSKRFLKLSFCTFMLQEQARKLSRCDSHLQSETSSDPLTHSLTHWQGWVLRDAITSII